MSFSDPEAHFRDILASIAHIDTFLEGFDLPAYRADLLVRSAVERQLSILTEAAFRLKDDAERLCPGPDWKRIRNLGNVIRHAYYQVESELIWGIVTLDLPPLKASVLRTLETLLPLD